MGELKKRIWNFIKIFLKVVGVLWISFFFKGKGGVGGGVFYRFVYILERIILGDG